MREGRAIPGFVKYPTRRKHHARIWLSRTCNYCRAPKTACRTITWVLRERLHRRTRPARDRAPPDDAEGHGGPVPPDDPGQRPAARVLRRSLVAAQHPGGGSLRTWPSACWQPVNWTSARFQVSPARPTRLHMLAHAEGTAATGLDDPNGLDAARRRGPRRLARPQGTARLRTSPKWSPAFSMS